MTKRDSKAQLYAYRLGQQLRAWKQWQIWRRKNVTNKQAEGEGITLKRLNEENSLKAESSDVYEKRLSDVVQTNSENIEKTKLVMSEVSLLVDKINKDYVTKAEFNSLVNDVNSFKTLIAKELKSSSKTKKSTKSKLDSMSNADIYKQAEVYFNKKWYTNAIENYEFLIKKNYKPAYGHYMVGEMNYRRKNYANAITYFKKSASLYSDASYMPKLMLHSAISMHKTGDKKNAMTFFKAVVAKYPQSSEATEAKKYM